MLRMLRSVSGEAQWIRKAEDVGSDDYVWVSWGGMSARFFVKGEGETGGGVSDFMRNVQESECLT